MSSVTMTEAPAPTPRLHSSPMDVGDLLRRVIEGDQRAWDELVGRFGGLVWSIARGYRLGTLTDDVVQTVWLRLAEIVEACDCSARVAVDKLLRRPGLYRLPDYGIIVNRVF